MPELAEVDWYRRQWNPGLGGTVTGIRLHSGKYVLRGLDERTFRRRIIGKKLISSERRGKQMLFRFSENNFLGVHLGMTGTTRAESAEFKPGKYDHLVLYQEKLALVFADRRQLGRIRFHPGPDLPDWWKAPPEIASREFDRKFFDEFLARHRNAPIKAVLLMQTGFAGIGNWMADEILWRAGVVPTRRTFRLTGSEREAVFQAAKFIVRRSLATIGYDFSEPPRNWLIHQKWKRNGVCPKHRTLLRHATVGGRTTAWCPKCQK
jgi:formamidopyrimidine-DNA glycosylase